MRFFYTIIFAFACKISFGQPPAQNVFAKDSLIVVKKNPKKGFDNEYLLFIPKGTPKNKEIFLIVEPNNTGKVSDTLDVHKNAAIDLASLRSVGNNVSTELRIPLLVPVFPRLSSQPLIYTHALDRDVMLEKTPELKRLDLQLLHMIDDAKSVLASMQVKVAPKFFMNGFSASATFTNRFSFLHPEKIQALAIGGFNGKLLLPQNSLNGVALDYPIGLADFGKLFGKQFDIETYKTIPQFIYMGKRDDNDAVQYDDAYSESERKTINENIGADVQLRYLECQKIYRLHKIEPIFKTYEDVGHFTTAAVNLDVIMFFHSQMAKK